MTTIVTINAGDNISSSRTDLNTNFSNLNSDKIETSVIDTDTTLAANSDSKIPSQKAVKAYVDTGGNVNASTTAKGIVEEATDAEVTAGTDTGGTGAKLFVPPSKLNTRINALLPTQTYSVGSLANSVVKTYFNIQLPFLLWTGAVSGDLTTSFNNWIRSSTDVSASPMGIMVNFTATGADSIYIGGTTLDTSPIRKNATSALTWADTNTVILDWWAVLPASSTGDIFVGGFGSEALSFQGVWNDTSGNGASVKFAQKSTGELMAVIAEESIGVSSSDISSGLTLTDWNNYRIELQLGTEARFYVNGTLKATLSGANLEVDALDFMIGFGRSNTAIFAVTAPTLSMEMNP